MILSNQIFGVIAGLTLGYFFKIKSKKFRLRMSLIMPLLAWLTIAFLSSFIKYNAYLADSRYRNENFSAGRVTIRQAEAAKLSFSDHFLRGVGHTLPQFFFGYLALGFGIKNHEKVYAILKKSNNETT